MGHLIVPREALTAQQERFAQLVAVHGLKLSVAYRQAYDCPDMKPETVWKEACKLAQHPKVTPRISELRKVAEARLELTVPDLATYRLLVMTNVTPLALFL